MEELQPHISQVLPYPNGDFHLTAGATSAISKGINPSYLTSVYTTDMDGNTRTGTWDLGAFEYGSTGGQTLSPPVSAPTSLTLVVN
jgi:hypothetical protein